MVDREIEPDIDALEVDAATAMFRDSMPLAAAMGMTCSDFGADRVIAGLAWAPELCTAGDIMHGGAIMALADAAGGGCAFANLPVGATGTSTIESKTNFFAAVREGSSLTATATPLHRGRTTIVVETELRDQTGKLVAKTTQTQSVLVPR